jgi:hypothetical protein
MKFLGIELTQIGENGYFFNSKYQVINHYFSIYIKNNYINIYSFSTGKLNAYDYRQMIIEGNITDEGNILLALSNHVNSLPSDLQYIKDPFNDLFGKYLIWI